MPSQEEQEVLYMLITVVRSMVERPDQVSVEPVIEEEGTIYQVFASPSDLGKFIGVNGRTARALRILLSANAARLRRNLMLDLSGNPADQVSPRASTSPGSLRR